jgi:hypothetical protein
MPYGEQLIDLICTRTLKGALQNIGKGRATKTSGQSERSGAGLNSAFPPHRALADFSAAGGAAVLKAVCYPFPHSFFSFW